MKLNLYLFTIVAFNILLTPHCKVQADGNYHVFVEKNMGKNSIYGMDAPQNNKGMTDKQRAKAEHDRLVNNSYAIGAYNDQKFKDAKADRIKYQEEQAKIEAAKQKPNRTPSIAAPMDMSKINKPAAPISAMSGLKQAN